MTKPYNPAPGAAIGARTGGTRHSSKPFKPKFVTQFCDRGVKHHCFRIPDMGWFVMVNIPDKARGRSSSKTWFALHSVAGVNSASSVNKYITTFILEGENKNKLLDHFLEMIANGECGEYHRTDKPK
jgi:hypothetical protein